MTKRSGSIGDHLRAWRERRRLSQLELSLRAEVSARHLSFVETGRAAPGRELVLRLSEELDIPRRERNALLVAAGFAPIFQQRSFDDPSFDSVRAILDMALEKQKPFPAYVIDRHWNVVAAKADDSGPAAIEGPAMLLEVETRLGRLSFLGATTVFGTPADVTLEEIALEVLYPADAFTDKTVGAAAAAAPEATPATVLPSPSLRATSRPAAH